MDAEECEVLLEELVEYVNQEGPLNYFVTKTSLIEGIKQLVKEYYEMDNALEQIGKYV